MPYVVLATWHAKPGAAEHIKQILSTVSASNRAEAKMLEFQAHVSTDDPNTFILYEKYTDSSGYDDHKNTESFQRHIVGEVIPNLADRSIQTMETFD